MSEQGPMAAEAVEAAKVKPYVAADQSMPEMTIKALVLGSVLGIVFAGSSVYLALKVGMTVSASIPIAVLSITLFRVLARATILENNIVQTTGSAGESIAFAVATVPPALLIMGYDMSPWLVMLIAVLGGLLGILMMIPLRRGLIVKEHGKLAYPEGTACAEVLMVGEKGGTDARMVFLGFGVGVLYKLLNAGFRFWSEAPETLLYWTERVRSAAGRVTEKVVGFNGGSIAAEISPELLGVGYIIGPRVAGVTVAGGVLSYLVLIPALKFFGQYIDVTVFPADVLIRDMSVHQVRNNYILYIGAGAVTMGGMISLGRALPSIASALKSGITDLFGGRALAAKGDRTDRDMPMSFVLIGSLVLALVMWLSPPLHLNLVGALLMIVFGFIFVTVSSRITGEIGSSSNPISGMTISAVLLTCLVFLALGWTEDWARAAVLSVGAVVCVAASNGGTTSQDLKTGYLVGGTPWKQQVAIMVGAVTSAVVVGWILLFLNDAYTTVVPKDYANVRLQSEPAGWVQLTLDPQGGVERADHVAAGTTGSPRQPVFALRRLTEIRGEARPGAYLTTREGQIRYVMDPGIGGVEPDVMRGGQRVKIGKLDAPKARLMALIVDGIMTQKLPWSLVLLGAFIALTVELCGVSALPFAVGVYLPISTTTTIFVGGFVRWLANRKSRESSLLATESSPGVLMSSGFIAGGAICGVAIAVFAAYGLSDTLNFGHMLLGSFSENNYLAMAMFSLLAIFLWYVATRQPAKR